MTVPVECAAVVKADGYGCGIEPVTTRLAKAGCRTFFVADIAEGAARAGIAPEATIYVLNGLMPSTGAGYRGRLSAAGHQQPDRACRVGCVRRDAATGAAAWRCMSIPA